MITIGLAVHYGKGYSTPLPKGWTLRESPESWSIGTDPDGQDYYLSVDTAYPRRVATKSEPGIRSAGDYYIDTERGVIQLTP